ncbi:MAG: NifB/NifX family molybdenum-iron cluster-binding protein [Desulfopila sp.]
MVPATPGVGQDDSGQPTVDTSVIRLPVAPRANHRIRFTPLTAKPPLAILPHGAIRLIAERQATGPTIGSALIAGPGDPLADVTMPLRTIALIHEAFADLPITIQTLGIGGLQHADRFEKAGITGVELLIDAVEPQIVEQIYAWIRPGFKTLKLAEAAAILVREQASAIQAFKDAGVAVRVVSTCYPTINTDHLEVVARKVADLGADEMVLTGYLVEPEADIALPELAPARLAAIAAALATSLPVTTGQPAHALPDIGAGQAAGLPRPQRERPNVAVVSSNGMDVDLHLGQAPQLLVYGPRADGLNCLLECRPAPPPGGGDSRWSLLADTIGDCFALLTASAGDRPRDILDARGVRVIITKDNIEATVDTLYGGGKKGHGKRTATPSRT